MMDGRIGYYVHHQGDGHRQRALAIARAAAGRIVLLGTGLAGRCGEVAVVDLPDDAPVAGDGVGAPPPPEALHYAPVGHDGLRRRTVVIAAWIAEARPALMVVDVSVEVAMLARLASTPTVYVRLSGMRDDAAHRQAFAAASGLLAPFHAELDDADTPSDLRRRTFYAPGLLSAPSAGQVEADVVLAVVGRGGEAGDGERWAEAAIATPHLRWRVIGGRAAPRSRPDNLEWLGWVEDAPDRIARAGVVVGAAGDGLVGAVIAAGRPFVCVPEPRPYGEQAAKAARLEALGAAVVWDRWPTAREWPGALDAARGLDPAALTRLHAPDGARRAADWLVDLAGRSGAARP